MSTVSYDDIELELSNLVRFDHHAVYDDSGADYQMTHVYLEVHCVFNPMATATSVPGNIGGSAALSLASLRHQLLQPRKKLKVMIGPDTILELPQPPQDPNAGPTASTKPDVRYGPKPVYCNVTAVHGTKTLLVTWACEAWINEWPGKHVLLSNRLSMAHDIDDLQMTIRTIRGRAVFNQQALALLNLTPDDFRKTFYFKTPDGFQRNGMHWTLTDDNTAVEYEIVDVQQPWSLGTTCPALRVDGSCTAINQTFPDLGRLVRGASGRYGARGTPWMAIVGALWDFVPLAEATIEVWGGPNTSRGVLADLAIALALNRLLFNNDPLGTIIMSARVTVGVRKNYARATLTARKGAGFVANVNPFTGPVTYKEIIRTDNDFSSAGIPVGVTDNPPWPDNATRGVYLGKLMAAAFLGEGEVPKTPGEALPNSQDATSGPPY